MLREQSPDHEKGPYSGSVSNDSRRELQAPATQSPAAVWRIPLGFLGYAVNLIEVNVNLRPWRTASGRHGLRETLLYRLFGTLQVYESKEQLKHARSCIKKDAISLDGAILRGNGVISFALSDVDVFRYVPEGTLHRKKRNWEGGRKPRWRRSGRLESL